ncbi:MAG TPA: Xaa-Pro peptidase family protein [Candidatus Dormibacteraeota bacterium]|nr:Xaa-Pro peptidase family protein [Candidatus Dormibacteraeota bacterium]
MSSSVAAAVDRLAGLRAWMAQHDLAAAYLTRPVSIAYLTGFSTDPHERLMALAVRPDRATLIVPAIEHENAVRQQSAQAEVVSWRDGEDPHELVRDALDKVARLGVENDHLTLFAAEVLRSRAEVRDLVDISAEIRRLRRTKSPAEVEKLVRAADITDSVTAEVMGQLSAGMSELAVANLLAASINAHGANLSFDPSVQSGANSAVPHHRPSGRVLCAGDLLLLDFGAEFEGYHADTTRMAVVGTPTPRQVEMHGLVLRAHDAAVAAVRAGTTAGAVDAAAREVVEAEGLGDRFFHRTGHGLGLEIHEDPSLDPGSSTVLEAGMAMTIEPGVYFPGWGGVRIEDDVVVEATGCRVLTKADRALRLI